ncbi:hypothetical protein EYF80_057358 [Liparis tanakae]|uniref:Uncharacterized protein n=1 Tax=Liparis tanakae TaxID=230148 RepID=A0A4Z2EV00_9TELE|nr:hypothetical protein EYF80_057358 [Liparis tanakae]
MSMLSPFCLYSRMQALYLEISSRVFLAMSRLRSSAEVKWPEDTPPVVSDGEVADERWTNIGGAERNIHNTRHKVPGNIFTSLSRKPNGDPIFLITVTR